MLTMTELETQCKVLGNHFFDKDSMRFFSSRIESRLLGGVYFVTSEQMENWPRAYTVRAVRDGGKSIATIGGFQGYKTRDEALELIRGLLSGAE